MHVRGAARNRRSLTVKRFSCGCDWRRPRPFDVDERRGVVVVCCRCAQAFPVRFGKREANADIARPSPALVSAQSNPKTKKKKKDVTLAPPTFPNGLKDFHEMTTAAEALTGLLGGPSSNPAVKNEKASGQFARDSPSFRPRLISIFICYSLCASQPLHV